MWGAPFPAAPVAAEEREYPTIVALGVIQPLESEEGLSTPLIVLNHESDGYFAGGAFTIQLLTTVLTVGMTHPVVEALDIAYRLRAQVITEGSGSDLYRNGRRLKELTFSGNSAALVLAANLFPEGSWRAALEVESLITRFGESEDTRSDYLLPGNFRQRELRAILTRQGLLGTDESRGILTLAAGTRQDARAWQLDPAGIGTTDYRKAELRWEQPYRWSEANRGDFTLVGMKTTKADLFNSYKIGGIGGQFPVGGYFRNEFRAREAWVANLTHEFFFAEDRRLSIHGDAAHFRELELPFLAGAPPSRTIASFGVGFRYGIRTLRGLPVIVRYAEGVRVPADSAEGRRRELMLVIALGF